MNHWGSFLNRDIFKSFLPLWVRLYPSWDWSIPPLSILWHICYYFHCICNLLRLSFGIFAYMLVHATACVCGSRHTHVYTCRYSPQASLCLLLELISSAWLTDSNRRGSVCLRLPIVTTKWHITTPTCSRGLSNFILCSKHFPSRDLVPVLLSFFILAIYSERLMWWQAGTFPHFQQWTDCSDRKATERAK